MEFKDLYGYLRNLQTHNPDCQIYLPKDEYASVISALNSNLSAEDRSRRILVKAIGNYVYTVINRGFDDYTIIRKMPIEDARDAYRRMKEYDERNRETTDADAEGD